MLPPLIKGEVTVSTFGLDQYSEAYSEFSETCKMKLFLRIVNG